MVLGMEVGLSPGDFVLDGEPAPPQKRAHSPKNSADVYCGQAAGWITMALGREVCLSPGDFVLHGDPAPPQKGSGAPSPIFGPLLLWPNGLMHQDANWYECRPQPRGFCVRWGPTPSPNQFSAHVYCGQRAEWIKMPLGTEVRLGPDDILLDGEPAPRFQKGDGAPILGPCVLRQMVGWIKLALGMQVGLVPGQNPPPPIFG